jgi:hypothetical protein
MRANRPVLQWNKILLKIDIFYDKALSPVNFEHKTVINNSNSNFIGLERFSESSDVQ